MIELNQLNGAAKHLDTVAGSLMAEGWPALMGCEMGIAFGGGVDRLGKLWKGRGIVWGFDTFSGHPKEIAEICDDTIKDGGLRAHAATCMDHWYQVYGTQKYRYGAIRAELDRQGLHNVSLVAGLIAEQTKIDYIPYLNYAMLDMDFPWSMRQGYRLVKPKLVKGSYLCLHDVVPKGHIGGMWEWYQEVIAEGGWSCVMEDASCYLAILQRE